ncbi:hypothetical protein K8I61_11495 [bacterium]|nr:hypothetical protein [bacterium]
MKRWQIALIVVVLSLGTIGGCPPSQKMSYVDNGVIKVGVDLNKGGSITFLADVAHQEINLINSADLGREIQQSYYSGPQPYGEPHPGWPNWPWNPIGAGDCYGNPSEVLEHVNDGSMIYVRSIPMQWALNGVPCECTFEQWIELDENAVLVHFKLNNNRSDKTYYGARHQELPAVYTTDRFHRLFTYNGNKPFTGGPIEQIVNSGPPWAYFTGTEKWAALVQDNGWGLGVYNPDAELFAGGFHGTPGSGDPEGSSTGYITPLRTEAIAWNTVYEYDAYFILGYLDDIRAFVYQNRP